MELLPLIVKPWKLRVSGDSVCSAVFHDVSACKLGVCVLGFLLSEEDEVTRPGSHVQSWFLFDPFWPIMN